MNSIKLIAFSALGALLFNSATFAQPDHAPAHGARDKGNSSQHQTQQHGSHHKESAQYGRVDLPRINERELRQLLRQHDAPRAESLPPGIQRNLERGKPLPPGIAKRFDGRLASQLPQYPGYEWERVGADVVLIEAATRVVVDVLVDVLR
ncbi:anti-virulence regulator CigR family protein [Halomonas sp. HAL1]|uniref:anti-virulence regulator CigR family protein n=1 Tax=Halomonas sp. HAL1 TaxID=550984 RepID=UPI00022D34BA|nr:anti-virulence regulator CigR family protein [Halomonas sp. HAL1]EHA16778.1 integral membrane protein [Halomonas sp. HAL1]WKV94732.1 anti-virulence regulator CigR family protein [Halomonas sp. HAL1]